MLSRALLSRAFFDRPAAEVAPDLLGRVLVHDGQKGTVAVRLAEVEAYEGESDPASHAFRGRTPRTAVMFGPPGHAYVYRSYGMHNCINVVCRPDGIASAVLLRAGKVVQGVEAARERSRPGAPERELARGPGRLTRALEIDGTLGGADMCAPAGALRLLAGAPVDRMLIRSGPRTGVTGAKEVPWRFWVDGDETVSAHRSHRPRRARGPRAPTAACGE